MNIHTHRSVDLDACASDWAVRQFVPGAKDAITIFHPVKWDGVDMEEGDIAVDIQAGGRGIKGKREDNGRTHSSFACIIETHAPTSDQQALAELVDFIDTQDTYGSFLDKRADGIDDHTRTILRLTGLNAILRYIQRCFPGNDRVVVGRMGEIFSGFLESGRARIQARVDVQCAEILSGGTVAVMNDLNFAVLHVLFEEKDVRIVVFVKGDNIVVYRANDETVRLNHPLLIEVIERAGEEAVEEPRSGQWFYHSAGFRLSWGGSKAPAETKSGVDPYDLARACVRALDSARVPTVGS